MNQDSKKQTLLNNENFGFLAAIGLAVVLGATAIAQDFRAFQGSNVRDGRSTIQAATAVPETTWNNFGRGFLRWFDPIFNSGNDIDNDEVGATTPVPLANWINPAPILVNPDVQLASGFTQEFGQTVPYRVALTSTAPSTLANPNPTGTVPYYEWTIGGLIAGQDYEVQANAPVGSTNIQPDGNAAPDPNDPHFPARYHLFEVTDANGTQTFLYDMDVDGGGFASLGGALQRFEANVAGTITVRLYATVVRNEFGTQLEPTDVPGTSVVYADAVRAVGQTVRDGSYVASPVVGELLSAPYLGGPTFFDQRVVSARNESTFIGALNKNFVVGVVTSFTHNGAVVAPATPLRRNMVWSWPAVRPFDLTQGEADRYATDRQAWVLGGPANYPRHQIFPQIDNLSATTTVAGIFVAGNTVSRIGPNYLSKVASAALTSTVTWGSDIPDGFYFVDVYLPTDDAVGATAHSVTYDILRGATVVDQITINQGSYNGWVRLPGQPVDGYENSAALPLSVRVSDQSLDPTDIANNRDVYADAVRFVGDADLAINSTPVMVNADVADGATTLARDVVIVARENGKIYCMDAHGDVTTGAQPKVFWTWPSEDPDTDPNNSATEDYGIATYPINFEMSSMAVAQDSGGNWVLVIGAENGRVYCLDVEGRGDGTTTRRWTYPDDFNPTNPTVPMTASNLGPITGSIAIAGNQVLIPSSNGRVISVDLTGNPATKTTTLNWQFPPANPPLGPLTMSPVVAAGQVFFGVEKSGFPTEGEVYALDLTTGTQNWMRDVRQDGITPFGRFGTSSPVYVEAALTGIGDTLYIADGTGYITALDAANGNVRFEDQRLTAGVTASLAFTHHRIIDNFGPINDAEPIILAAENSGKLVGIYADGTLNSSGNTEIWKYYLEGTNQISSFAVGGWPNAAGPLANRSHVYIGDSLGYLYAFSSEDDTDSVPGITPGQPPGSGTPNPSEPNELLLSTMIEQDDFVLLSPETYRNLLNLSQSTAGLDYTDITAAKAQTIQRRDYEMGETLYIAVWDIWSPSAPEVNGYYVEFEVEGIGDNAPDRTANVREVNGAPSPAEGGIALIQISLQATGSGSVVPGAVEVEARARTRRTRGEEVDLAVSATPPAVGSQEISVANPFALGFFDANGNPVFTVGNTLVPSDPNVVGNGPTGNFGAQPKNIWTDGFAGNAVVPGWQLATESAAADPVAHGSSAIALMSIYDRSLTTLLNGGNRGLNNVRWHSRDMSWQPLSDPALWPPDTDLTMPVMADPVTDIGIFRPLNIGDNKAGWLYKDFEDYPYTYPNPSLDYPDVKRSTLLVTKEAFGDAQNPLFNGVQLQAPAYTAAQLATYETTAGYEAGLTRIINPTRFDVSWNIQTYQPASANGYVGRQTVYVDSDRPGLGDDDAYREFSLGVNVGVDRRPLTGTPTVDLGSMPTGGGFLFDGTNPVGPWAATSPFQPSNPAINQGNLAQFQQFSVLNDGNTNLVDVRLSKAFSKLVGGNKIDRPLELFAPAEHEMAWLDGAVNMVSSLDPLHSPTGATWANVDPNGRIPLQKPRVGDIVPTRLSTNPFHRANPNLRVGTGWLLDPNVFNPGDPYVGVAAPLGTPTGSYVRKIYAFDDDDDVAFPTLQPSLGQTLNSNGATTWIENEPFTDPGITLKFNVREARLTNYFTAKASANVEAIAPAADFAWANRQPTGVRDGNGTVFMAWSSDRQDAADPAYVPDIADTRATDGASPWRIYITGLQRPAGSFLGASPLNDLNGFVPFGSLWFRPSLSEWPANGTAAGLFTVLPGEVIDTSQGESSFAFTHPAFPSHGLTSPFAADRWDTSTFADTALAFIGEAWKTDKTGTRVRVNQLMLTLLTMNTDGTVTANGTFPMPYDTTTIKGRPTVINDNGFITVIYPGRANGVTQLFRATFQNGVWTPPTSLGLANAFEDMGNPTMIARNSTGLNQVVNDVFFTATVRGRSNSEAFMGQLQPNSINAVVDEWRPYADRLDKLEFDATTGTYWTPGVDWRLSDADLASFNLSVRRFDPVSGTFVFQDLMAAGTNLNVDRKTRELSMKSSLGGQVFVDAQRGSVKFAGGMMPQNADLFITYSPRFVRISGAQSAVWVDDGAGGRIVNSTKSTGANYRNTSVIYDPRLIGININPDPDRADQNRTQDLNYWFDVNGAAAPAGGNITHDRFWLVTSRTSSDGGSASRPYMSSFRFGIQLPTPVATNADGSLVNLTVNFAPAGALSEPPFYQVDPVNGRIYFTAPLEGRTVSVTYQGVDQSGNPLAGTITLDQRVNIIPEKGEFAMPIEQVANESDVWLAIDPIWSASLQGRRPPLMWTFWTSGRTSTPDVYFQTLAPITSPIVPGG